MTRQYSSYLMSEQVGKNYCGLKVKRNKEFDVENDRK